MYKKQLLQTSRAEITVIRSRNTALTGNGIFDQSPHQKQEVAAVLLEFFHKGERKERTTSKDMA